MSNHTSIRARDTDQHKNSMVDKCILDEDSAGIAPRGGMVYHAIACAINQAIQTTRPRP